MADKLVLNECRNGYQIGWELEGEGDIGACLGQDEFTEKDLQEAKLAFANGKDDEGHYEHILATMTVKALADGRSGWDGYYWESFAKAKKALSLAKAALQAAKSNVPWPDWAIKAKAAGWKAPKGWKPGS